MLPGGAVPYDSVFSRDIMMRLRNTGAPIILYIDVIGWGLGKSHI